MPLGESKGEIEIVKAPKARAAKAPQRRQRAERRTVAAAESPDGGTAGSTGPAILVRDTEGNLYWVPAGSVQPFKDDAAEQLIYRLIAEKGSRMIGATFVMVCQQPSLEGTYGAIRAMGTK